MAPRPNNTNGNAVPSLRPPSPVRPKRRRRDPAALRSCTSEASTGSVGASTAPITSASGQAKPRMSMAATRDAEDGHHHRDRREPQRQAPAPVADRHAHLDADGEQRDQQRDLGDGFEHRELAQRMQLEHVEHRRAERESDHQIDHGGAHRQPVEKPPEQRDHHQQYADEHEPECGHARTLGAAVGVGPQDSSDSGVVATRSPSL